MKTRTETVREAEPIGGIRVAMPYETAKYYADTIIGLAHMIDEDGCPCGGKWRKGIATSKDTGEQWYAFKCEYCEWILPLWIKEAS